MEERSIPSGGHSMGCRKKEHSCKRENSMPLIHRLREEPWKMGLEKQSGPGSPVGLNVPLWSANFIL